VKFSATIEKVHRKARS